MKVEVFCMEDDAYGFEAYINNWLKENGNEIEVKHITQSESLNGGEHLITVLIWYELLLSHLEGISLPIVDGK